jgi:hypothetical protein
VQPVVVEERTYADVVVNFVTTDRIRLQVPWKGATMTGVLITRYEWCRGSLFGSLSAS